MTAPAPADETDYGRLDYETAQKERICPRPDCQAAVTSHPNPRHPLLGSEYRCSRCGLTWTD